MHSLFNSFGKVNLEDFLTHRKFVAKTIPFTSHSIHWPLDGALN